MKKKRQRRKKNEWMNEGKYSKNEKKEEIRWREKLKEKKNDKNLR